jgi:glutamate-1-semialdehyde 2,1-aminomutase
LLQQNSRFFVASNFKIVLVGAVEQEVYRVQPGSIGPHSAAAFEAARHAFPDGVNRTTVERDPVPRYVSGAKGAYFTDADGCRLLDLNNNFTTLIHGHAFEPVVEAVTRQLRDGSCFANPTTVEIDLAELIIARVPNIDRIRFVSTGTEAVMYAIKAARAYTGRHRIAKFEGCFHGAYDYAEVSQASTPQNWGSPEAPARTVNYNGMPPSLLDDVVVLRFNDAEGVRRLLAQQANEIAAVLIDPMPSRAGLIAPEPAFVAALQDTCAKHGILIISDEVLNFRQGYEGAAFRYGLEPDLFSLGKIIGGGLPIGAVAGRADIMRVFAAENGRARLPQGGTFSANPLSMVAGLAAMQFLDRSAIDRLGRLGDAIRERLSLAIRNRQAPFCVVGAASLFRIHPKRRPPRDFRESYMSAAESAAMLSLWRFFQQAGVNLPNGAAASLSTPMGETEMDLICSTFERFLEAERDVFSGIDS